MFPISMWNLNKSQGVETDNTDSTRKTSEMFLLLLLPVALAVRVDQKIVGGSDTTIDDHPHQARFFGHIYILNQR